MTQTDALLAELRYRGDRGITALEAIEAVGTLRLAARIYDLRQRGHVINEEIVVRGNKRFARYWIEKPADQMEMFG